MKKFVSTFIIMIFILFTIVTYSDARAGGGGSYSSFSSSSSRSIGSSGSGGDLPPWVLILATIFGIFTSGSAGVAIGKIIERKNEEAILLMDKIDDTDRIWNRDEIRARIEDVYFKVQEAWTKRDQDIAKDYMSQRLYDKHKRQTDELIEKKLINQLDRINLRSMQIIGIYDDEIDENDKLQVVINGSMIDYMYDEINDKIIAGDHTSLDEFTEIWSFIRKNDTWILNQIDQTVDSNSLKNMKVFSHIVKVENNSNANYSTTMKTRF